jgi:hypothetical protein
MILIPSQSKTFIQNNRSDILGNIWSSFNLDLTSNLGRMRVSPRLLVTTTTANDTSLTTPPCAFAYYNNALWTISGTKVHTAATTNGLIATFAADAATGTPTDCDVAYSDMVLFNNELYVSGKSNQLYGFNGTNWTSNSSPYTIGAADVGPHPMTVYSDKLYYVRSDNIIYSLSTSHVVSSVLLTYKDGNQRIIWMRAASNRIWFGTVNKQGGKGEISEWDGAAGQVTRTYRLKAQAALACVIKDDVPYVMDSNGRLLAFNGGTFEEIDRLPIKTGFLVNATSSINNRFIHPNGMSLINDRINLLIANQNSDSGATVNENLPSGIWEYSAETGLHHKHSFSYHASVSGSVTDYGQNRLVTSTSPTDVALIPAGALSDIRFYTNTATTNGTFLAGCMYNTSASATSAGVFMDDTNDTIQKYGYFVTPWIDSQNIKDTWQRVVQRYRRFLNSSDKLIVKYRTVEVSSSEISITWVNTTSFTTTDSSILGKEGYEVEVLQGTGSGMCAHITRIDWDNTNYTVTVDETFTGVTTGTAKIRLQAWTRLSSVSNQTSESNNMNLGKTSERIQFKVCMLFTGKNELHQLAIINKTHEPLA